ncbi:MAG: BspA family leucine-rich repeat surface protein [Clostridia bacterium]|nr:BspA family leucine-rich repeat surface protein [Clostridia bacterium]
MLLTVVLSACILSAFFVANNLVINDNEVEAATGANYTGNCGTKNTSTGAAVADITFTYTHGTNGSVVVKGNGKTVISKGSTSTANTFIKHANTINAYTELVNCSYRFENVVFSGDCSSFFTVCKKMSSVTFVNCNFAGVTTCKSMFSGLGNLTSIDMSGISFDNCTSFELMFYNTSIGTANFKNVYMGKSATCKNMFQNSVVVNAYFDGATISNNSTSSTRILSYMFNGCSYLKKATFTGASISNVTAMDHMFNECHSLVSADFKGMDMSSCTTFADMFYNCYNMSTVTFAGASMGNGVTASTTKEMFKLCEDLTSVSFNNTNMLSVTDMSYMFQDCYSLMYTYFDGTRLNNVTTMAYMFNNCKSLLKFEMKATSESLQALTTMTHMFDNAVDISYFEMQNFNLAKLSNMEYMFANTDIRNVSFYHNTFGVSFSCANMFKEC